MRISDWSSDVCSSDLKLGLDPLESFFDRGVGGFVPRGIDDIDLAQRLNAVARHRMGAAIGLIIVLLHRIAKFEILQLLEKGEAAAAADPGLRQILRARRIGGRFLDAAEGEELAQRGLLDRKSVV